MVYICPVCKAPNKIVNQCGCDKNNLPTKPVTVLAVRDTEDGLYVSVYEDETHRYMAITEDEGNLGLVQGKVLLNRKSWLEEVYARAIVTFASFWSRPRNITLFGLGIGNLLRAFRGDYPDVSIHVVEKYMEVMVLAEEYFLGQPMASQCVYHRKDYIEYLTEPSARHQDLIVVDVFTHKSKIKDMTSPDFFYRCIHSLSEIGVVMVNLVGDPDAVSFVCQAAEFIFPYVYLYPIEETSNSLLVASRVPASLASGLEEFACSRTLRVGRRGYVGVTWVGDR